MILNSLVFNRRFTTSNTYPTIFTTTYYPCNNTNTIFTTTEMKRNETKRTQAERSVWETMQTKAEEKRKGYCCVVWCEKPVTREMLARLEQLSTSGEMTDEETGEACIEVNIITNIPVDLQVFGRSQTDVCMNLN